MQQPLQPWLHFLYPAFVPDFLGQPGRMDRGVAQGSTRMSVGGGGGGGRALQASVLSHVLGNSSDVKCADPP